MYLTYQKNLLFITLLVGLICSFFIPATGYPEENRVEKSPAMQPGSATMNREDAQGPLSLERCIEIALANNPDISFEGWNVSAAGARFDAAKAARWPNITVDGSYQTYNDPQRLIQARFNNEKGYFDNDLFVGGVTFKMPIFTGGRITSDINTSELLRLSAEHKLSRTRDEVVFNVSSVFYTILGQKQIIKSLRSSQEALEENKRVITQLYTLKKAARVDLLRIDVRIANLEQSLIKEQNALATQRRVLANFMGVKAPPESLPEEIPIVRTDMPYLEDLLDKAFKRRPDYLSLKSDVAAQSKRIDATQAQRFPTLAVQAGYGSRANSVGHEHVVSSGGVGLSFPVFDGGLISAKVHEEQARLAGLKERLRKIELQIRTEVETTLLGYQANQKRMDVNRKAMEQGKESLRIEIQKYELGMGSATNVLDAQAALVQTETDYYRSLADYQIDKAKLILDTGGAL
jgi:outer membrane protein TolC